MPSSPRPGGAYHHGDLRRALVEAATAIVAEDQNWDFSLREVARRAGVSHNAPYRHFPEKLDLLAAVAATGFELLRLAMIKAAEASRTPDDALIAIGDAYVRFGTENPARYRLMFSTALAASKAALPLLVGQAAAAARDVLSSVLADGVRQGRFAASPDDGDELSILALSAWAIVHGLTMLVIDGLSDIEPSPSLPERVGRALLDGIRKR
jgi:AcrR family transcriptional regulator